VIDLLEGQAVHAVGGRRAYYQPIESVLHPSSNPIALAAAIRDRLSLHTLYLADLDAIAGAPPRTDIYRQLIAGGNCIWVDAGISDIESAAPLHELGPSSLTLVAGLETLRDKRTLGALVHQAGAGRVVFSLDLFDGSPRIAAPAAWGTEDPRKLAQAAVECGVRELIILDLARVGTSLGLSTSRLMLQILEDHPSVRVTVGGGISRMEEVLELRDAGAAAVLVGSAIHDGRIGPRELKRVVTDNV
jgi:phosphoribosylformimino-5-aminoimidazole carboxamide ribotide isomerase